VDVCINGNPAGKTGPAIVSRLADDYTIPVDDLLRRNNRIEERSVLYAVRTAIGVAPRVLFTVLRYTLWMWLRRRFRVRIHYDRRFASVRPPYVVLANHVNFWDPFLVAMPFGPPVHFIAADGNFRSHIMRRLMAVAGTVPKAKARNDLESIRALQRLIQEGKIIGIFPEGQRSWDGTSRPVLSGTPKLVRLLQAPVISVRLRGGYLSMPRWTQTLRKGELHLDVQTILTRPEIRTLPREEVFRRIAGSVTHDETVWQRETGTLFVHPRRAEHAETALFWCPSCGGWDTLHSSGNTLSCGTCGYTTWFAPSGTLYEVAPDGTRSHHRYGSVAGWNGAQLTELDRQLDSPQGPLPVTIDDAELLTGHRSRVLYPHGAVTVSLTRDSLTITGTAIRGGTHIGTVINSDSGISQQIPVDTISGIHVQYAHQLEFYSGGRLYVLRMKRPGDSAYRLEETVLAIQRRQR
jgi:1-acyl-sn-glycerol-3-phosphate acyltransferase